MPYNGSGTFQRLYSWQTDAANGIKIRADRMDNEDDGFATGLSTAICKDGQQTLTGNIPFSGMKITGYGTTNSPNARSDVPQLGQVQDSGAQWGSTSGGSADAQTITLSPAITAYAAGQTFRFIAGYTNATTTPTLSVNSLAAKTVRKENGALAAGDITAGRTYVVVYDGTYLQLVNPAAATFGTPTRTTSTKTADYTVLSADKNTLFFGNSGSNRTLTLIAAATAAAGFNIGFVNISTGNWTIDGNSSETIDGETTIVVPPLQGVELYCDGSNWHITATSNYKPQQAVVMIGDGLTARTTNGFGSYTASKVTTNQVMLTGAAYDATTAEYGQFRFRLPPDFDASGSFYAQVAWWHGSTTTNFGVSWNVQMLAVSDDDTLDAAFGTAIEITDTGGTTNDLYHTAWSTAITPAGSAAANDWLYVELYRNPAAAGDTLAVDAVVIGLTILVPFKKFGNSNKDICSMAEIVLLLPGGGLGARRAHPDGAPLPALNAVKGAWKHVVDTPPSFNPAIETRAATGHTVDGDTVTIAYNVTARPLADVKADRLAALAAYRYERETGGTTIGGVAVATDRQSQAMISGAYAAAQNDVIGSFDWKADSGWVTLDKPTMIAIGAAVAAHVQACFTNEREHTEAIAALNSASAVAAYDFTAGWP